MMVNPERFIGMTSLCCLEVEVPSWLSEDSCFEVSCSDCNLFAIFNMFQANKEVYIITEPTCYGEEE